MVRISTISINKASDKRSTPSSVAMLKSTQQTVSINQMSTELLSINSTHSDTPYNPSTHGNTQVFNPTAIHARATNTPSTEWFDMLKSLLWTKDVMVENDTVYWDRYFVVGRFSFEEIFDGICRYICATDFVCSADTLGCFLTEEACAMVKQGAMADRAAVVTAKAEELVYPVELAKLFDSTANTKAILVMVKYYMRGIPNNRINELIRLVGDPTLWRFELLADFFSFVSIAKAVRPCSSGDTVVVHNNIRVRMSRNTRTIALLWMLFVCKTNPKINNPS